MEKSQILYYYKHKWLGQPTDMELWIIGKMNRIIEKQNEIIEQLNKLKK